MPISEIKLTSNVNVSIGCLSEEVEYRTMERDQEDEQSKSFCGAQFDLKQNEDEVDMYERKRDEAERSQVVEVEIELNETEGGEAEIGEAERGEVEWGEAEGELDGNETTGMNGHICNVCSLKEEEYDPILF